VVTKLNLHLQSGEFDGIFQGHRMSSIHNCFSCLLIKKIQLYRISGIDVGIAVEIFSLQQQNVGFHNSLLTQSFAVIHPIHFRNK